MVPKIIHCCWLSGEAKTPLAARCRASWERFAPDWEICEWDVRKVRAELDSGVGVPPFVTEALARRKWAFAADWVRFAALYLKGGLYFDCDFELVKPIEALPLDGAFVAGQWLPDGSVGPEPAVLALEKGSPVAQAMVDRYATAAFDAHATCGELLSAQLRKSTLRLSILPPEVLAPIDVRGVCHRTDATVGIHHCAMSWVTPRRRLARWLSWHGLRAVVDLLLAHRATGVILFR